MTHGRDHGIHTFIYVLHVDYTGCVNVFKTLILDRSGSLCGSEAIDEQIYNVLW